MAENRGEKESSKRLLIISAKETVLLYQAISFSQVKGIGADGWIKTMPIKEEFFAAKSFLPLAYPLVSPDG